MLDYNILRLQISMDNSMSMDKSHSLKNIAQDI